MLMDWSLVGSERRFEINVRHLDRAVRFYRDVLCAEEAFRLEGEHGDLVRVGLTIGGIGFAVTTDTADDPARPSLSTLAAELGLARLAIILRVEDPSSVRQAAVNAGSVPMEWPDAPRASVIGDPFGVHWAIMGI